MISSFITALASATEGKTLPPDSIEQIHIIVTLAKSSILVFYEFFHALSFSSRTLACKLITLLWSLPRCNEDWVCRNPYGFRVATYIHTSGPGNRLLKSSKMLVLADIGKPITQGKHTKDVERRCPACVTTI